jgi:hypothetical protein
MNGMAGPRLLNMNGLAADDVLHRRRAAAVGNVHRETAHGFLEQLACQVVGRITTGTFSSSPIFCPISRPIWSDAPPAGKGSWHS